MRGLDGDRQQQPSLKPCVATDRLHFRGHDPGFTSPRAKVWVAPVLPETPETARLLTWPLGG